MCVIPFKQAHDLQMLSAIDSKVESSTDREIFLEAIWGRRTSGTPTMMLNGRDTTQTNIDKMFCRDQKPSELADTLQDSAMREIAADLHDPLSPPPGQPDRFGLQYDEQRSPASTWPDAQVW